MIVALNRAINAATARGDEIEVLNLRFLQRAAYRAANRERMNLSAQWAAIRSVGDACRYYSIAP
jgi:flagellar biosynthesis/type III secretory pathway M-ring protein FliF/YscJ